MSGFWYSSPIRFQYAVLANSRSYGSRSFCSLIFCGQRRRLAAAVAFCPPARDRTRRLAAGVALGRRLVLILRDVDERHARRRRSRAATTSSAAGCAAGARFPGSCRRSSLPPATKPATSTRWNADTSSLALIGVSIGTSNSSPPQASRHRTAHAAAIAPSARRLLVLAEPRGH